MSNVSYDAELVKVGSHYDMQIDTNGDIKTRDFFDTAILLSLFGERRASSSDVPISENRRGWIGNESFDDEFENGSLLWLSEQSRVTRTTLNEIETSAKNGLQWMVDDDVSTKVTTLATISNGVIILNVTIERTNSRVEKRFYELWNNTGV